MALSGGSVTGDRYPGTPLLAVPYPWPVACPTWWTEYRYWYCVDIPCLPSKGSLVTCQRLTGREWRIYGLEGYPLPRRYLARGNFRVPLSCRETTGRAGAGSVLVILGAGGYLAAANHALCPIRSQAGHWHNLEWPTVSARSAAITLSLVVRVAFTMVPRFCPCNTAWS